MSDMPTKRTPTVIASEINTIKYNAGKMLLGSLIEIGQRLKEAKALIKHGEWSKWLEESVDFSQSRANNLIRLYETYGKPQSALSAAEAQTQEVQELSYTQALILLGVPEEERTQIISEWDIDNMTTRELQKALAERKQAQLEKEQAEQENAELKKALELAQEINTKLASEREKLKTATTTLQQDKQKLEKSVETKAIENTKLCESMEYKSLQRVKNQLAITEIKVLTGKVAFRYEELTKAFKEFEYEMNLLLKMDKDAHAEYAKMLSSFLMSTIGDMIGPKKTK